MIRRPPRSTQSRSSAASDVYKRQLHRGRLAEDLGEPGVGPRVRRRHPTSLTDPAVSPSMNGRWRIRDSTMSGAAVSTVPAIVSPQFEAFLRASKARPTGIVRISSEFVTISGHRLSLI